MSFSCALCANLAVLGKMACLCCAVRAGSGRHLDCVIVFYPSVLSVVCLTGWMACLQFAVHAWGWYVCAILCVPGGQLDKFEMMIKFCPLYDLLCAWQGGMSALCRACPGWQTPGLMACLHCAKRAWGPCGLFHNKIKLLPLDGMSALCHACRGGHLDCVKLLVDNKADLKTSDNQKQTPLHKAAIVVRACLSSRGCCGAGRNRIIWQIFPLLPQWNPRLISGNARRPLERKEKAKRKKGRKKRRKTTQSKSGRAC
eukprot:1154472-Pelagomonas_calceolata.AAC.9